jgi:hypothetical protein
MMESTYDLLTAHPDLVPRFLSRQGARGPNAVRLGVVLDGRLTAAGVPAADVPQARRVLIVHAIGSAAFATGPPVVPGGGRPMPAGELRRPSRAACSGWLSGITAGPAPG